MQLIDRNFYRKKAEQIFNDVCYSDTSIAQFYNENESIKKQHCEEILNDLLNLIDANNKNAIGNNLRERYAEVLENTITADFYVKLIEKDREIVSKYIFESSREKQDESYYQSLALNFTYSTILDSLIYLEQDETEVFKELKILEKSYIKYCKDYCDILLLIAKAVNAGGDINESEKENTKYIILSKEKARKKLAGEMVH